MSVDTTTLKTKLASAIDNYIFGSTDSSEVTALALSISTMDEPNIMTVVATINLPNLELYDSPNAVVCFITSLGIFAISSNKKWITLDGRLLRDDSGTIISIAFGWGNYPGDGTANKSSPVCVIGDFNDWCQVSAGAGAGGHSLAIRENGTLWGWGGPLGNQNGQLGTGNTLDFSSPVSVVGGFTDWCQVSVRGTSAAIRTNGTAWAWGAGGFGALGDGTTTNKCSPVSVIGGFTDWCQVSIGGSFMLALRTNCTLWSWGYNGKGALGDGTTVAKCSPISVIGGFNDWCQVSAGGAGHVLAIRTNGTLWAWGCAGGGRLGVNGSNYANLSSPVSVVGGFTDWCHASAARLHSLAIRTNGSLWSWGCNNGCQLGDGTSTNRSSPVSVVGGFTDWCRISSGGDHSLAIRTNGSLWAWGCGFSGALGNNCCTNFASPISVIGNFTEWSQISAGYRTSLGIVTK
jgi:alpha-tubulin suppressor-like RCC1 family protein